MENLLKNIIDSMNDCLIVISPGGRIKAVNYSTCRVLGYKKDKLLGLGVRKIFAEEEEEEEEEEVLKVSVLKKLVNEGRLRNNKVNLLTKTGNRIPVSISGAAMKDKVGDLTGIVITARDISDQIRWERELEFSNKIQEAVIEGVPLGIILKDKQDRIVYINKQMGEYLSKDGDKLIGKQMTDVLSKSENFNSGKFLRRLRTVKREKKIFGPTEVSLGNGYFFEFLCPIMDKSGGTEYTLSVYEDITERKSLQIQIAQSGKLAAVGQLAAGVAHEVNNPLAAAQTHLEVLRNELDDSSFHKDGVGEAIEAIANNIVRAANIVDHLRDFSRPSKGERKQININDVIEKSMDMLNQQFANHGIRVIRKYGRNCIVYADPNRMEQVFVNLLTNARDAIEAKKKGGGTITFRTKKSRSGIEIHVHDTGVGMSPSDIEDIFNPFFTTKEVGKGMGLGLSIIHRIIEEHSGSILVDSVKGRGSTFILRLPEKRRSQRS